MYIHHTLISVGSLVREWTLMEPEQSLCDLART